MIFTKLWLQKIKINLAKVEDYSTFYNLLFNLFKILVKCNKNSIKIVRNSLSNLLKFGLLIYYYFTLIDII